MPGETFEDVCVKAIFSVGRSAYEICGELVIARFRPKPGRDICPPCLQAANRQGLNALAPCSVPVGTKEVQANDL